MATFELIKGHLPNQFIPILDAKIAKSSYTAIDLSVDNPELKHIDLFDPEACQVYINRILRRNSAKVAYGGYLEKRNLYDDKVGFSAKGRLPRNIHLGMDFWTIAGTKVLVPLDGTVHSFQNNAQVGDYGPTLILKHELKGVVFYTLYGHLSLESLDGLFVGREFKQGDALAALGTPDINVNYAPHLHFQFILDVQDKKGDYPGVCTQEDLGFYRFNCPNPNLLLRIHDNDWEKS